MGSDETLLPRPKTRLLAGRAQIRMGSDETLLPHPKTRLLAGRAQIRNNNWHHHGVFQLFFLFLHQLENNDLKCRSFMTR